MPELIDKKRTEAKIFLIARHFIDRPDREVELVKAVIHRCCEEIDKQPTIESEPVRHGRWDEIQCFSEHGIEMASYECTSCGNDIERQRGLVPPYCEFCGAKMDATDTNVGGKGNEEMDLSPLDFLAAEYDRKHPQGIRFVDCMEGADDGACKKV